jgi:hypothetical protein
MELATHTSKSFDDFQWIVFKFHSKKLNSLLNFLFSDMKYIRNLLSNFGNQTCGPTDAKSSLCVRLMYFMQRTHKNIDADVCPVLRV